MNYVVSAKKFAPNRCNIFIVNFSKILVLIKKCIAKKSICIIKVLNTQTINGEEQKIGILM